MAIMLLPSDKNKCPNFKFVCYQYEVTHADNRGNIQIVANSY